MPIQALLPLYSLLSMNMLVFRTLMKNHTTYMLCPPSRIYPVHLYSLSQHVPPRWRSLNSRCYKRSLKCSKYCLRGLHRLGSYISRLGLSSTRNAGTLTPTRTSISPTRTSISSIAAMMLTFILPYVVRFWMADPFCYIGHSPSLLPF
ncbi:hypothetical protein BDQ17DRAFT_1097567 [Cyathus striatus]|nr:hypothetical protein BDQ17DRAFT_1097567 [Cyathus striatus]